MKDEYTEELRLRIERIMEENPEPLADDWDEEDESVFDDVSSWFVIGLKNGDRELMAAALECVASMNLYRDVSWDDWIKRRIGEWSEFTSVCKHLKNGGKFEWSELPAVLECLKRGEKVNLENRSTGFNTFMYTPSELVDIYSCSPIGISPVREVMGFVSEHLYDLWLLNSSQNESLFSLVKDYLGPWLDDFLSLLYENTDALTNDIDAASFLCALMTDEKYDRAMMRALDLFSPRLASTAFKSSFKLLSGSPLKTAIALGNRKAYERLIGTGFIPDDLVYPERDGEILSSLFSHSMLLPGTEEGRRAFMRTIERYNPGAEILERIYHPSYWNDDNASALTPLTAAVRNVNFSPDKYSLIIRDKEDIERWDTTSRSLPPLGYALLSRKKKKVDALLSLGADTSWRDRCGNSILHYAAEKIDNLHLIDAIAAVTPPEILESRNIFGERPLESVENAENVPSLSTEDMLSSLFSLPLSNSSSTLIVAPSSYPEYRFRLGAFLSLISEHVWDITTECGTDMFSTSHTRSLSELEHRYTSPFQGRRNHIIFIENVENLLREQKRRTEEILSSLNARSNVTLIVSTQMPYSSLLDNFLPLADGWSIVMLPTLSRLGFSRIFNTEKRITTDVFSVLVRCNGEFFRSSAYYEKPRKKV